MAIRNARSISIKELEDRRHQAVHLYQQGMSRSAIAPLVGAHRNAVGRWINDWQAQGEAALTVAAPGRPRGSGRRLDGWQAASIKKLITDKMPDQLKFPFALWTREAVQMLIRDRFDIDMPIRTVGDYLKRWGFTPQRPAKRAYERCDAQTKRWLELEYPAIAARARQEKAEIQWGDETGIRSDEVAGRSFSPKGRTPVVKRKGCRERLSMFSTVTNRGKLRFSIYPGALNADRLVDFLARLVRDAKQKIFLILDNLRVHHSKKVKAFLAARGERIEVFYLPRYSPELNPDEYLNSDFKRQVRSRPDSRRKGTLERHARSVMHAIQRLPERVISYFRSPHTQYAL